MKLFKEKVNRAEEDETQPVAATHQAIEEFTTNGAVTQKTADEIAYQALLLFKVSGGGWEAIDAALRKHYRSKSGDSVVN